MGLFDLYDYYHGFSWDYPAPRALTANQLRVKKIKRKVQARKMLKTKKGLRNSGNLTLKNAKIRKKHYGIIF